MGTKRIAAIFILAAGCAACGKPAPENIPRPKTDGAAETASVSTGPTLTAPGNYLKTSAGHVGEARAAKALFEKTARLELDGPDPGKTAGN